MLLSAGFSQIDLFLTIAKTVFLRIGCGVHAVGAGYTLFKFYRFFILRC